MIKEFLINEEDNKFFLSFKLSKKYKSYVVRCESLIILSSGSHKNGKNIKFDEYNVKYLLEGSFLDFTKTYSLYVIFDDGDVAEAETSISDYYDSPEFNEKYTYDKELGCICNNNKTTFRVWSPFSKDITLRLYKDDIEEYQMAKIGNVFEISFDKNLHGTYYTYVVNNFKYGGEEITDPYSKAVSNDGKKSMVIDHKLCNPEGFNNFNINEINPLDLVIYESHIADLTSSNTWNGKNPKTFKGFYEEGTTFTKNGITVKTGFDHIKELGVNAVQIQPINDAYNFYKNGKLLYNWNYNPRHYNALNNIFTNLSPIDAIKEFKELVMKYTTSGINVIIDVVYNHIYKAELSNFDVLMPGYYFRYYKGHLSNGSGCGNELASERKMVSKFIIDSVMYYAKYYKVSGFRFDLMGLIDINTMNELTEKLHEFNNNIVVYGEPWAGGLSTLNNDISSMQYNIEKYNGFGAFNDKLRDALVKGGMSDISYCGFVNAVPASGEDIHHLMRGINGYVGEYNNESYKCLNYTSCHDNYTLYDRLVASGVEEDEIKNMAMLAGGMVLTSKAMAFIYSGEEFLRTKIGDFNSYKSSYEVNEIDYSLKIKNYDMFKNYQKLIHLHTSGLFNQNINVFISADASAFYYDVWSDDTLYKIIHNSYNEFDVNFSGYDVYLDTLGKNDLKKIYPHQTLILCKEDDDKKKKNAGVLMHITSIPSKYGVGTLGEAAFKMIDFFKECGFSIWQILPLGPTGYGDSPYQSISANALNHYMIDLDILKTKGLLLESEYSNVDFYDTLDRVNYQKLFNNKMPLLRKAFQRFNKDDKEFIKFVDSKEFEDYSLFMTIKEMFEFKQWVDWPEEYKKYSPKLIDEIKKDHLDNFLFWQWTQFEFLSEWNDMHKYALSKGISIMGDIPYYVSFDSVEVWMKPEMFDLKHVGGCPPDAFSEDGQYWGNPCYDWEYMKKDNYSWWNKRIYDCFKMVDILRIDHFRGFDRYYSIPKEDSDAKGGKWINGPKAELFKDKLDLNIVAEDLGVIDSGVIDLMNAVKYPGMKVFEFAFDGNMHNANLPSNYSYNTIAYTGTHDNATFMQHILEFENKELLLDVLKRQADYFGIKFDAKTNEELLYKSIEILFRSKAKTVMLPIQDILCQDGNSRMNLPSSISTSNWSYRVLFDDIKKYDVNLIKNLIEKYNR